MDEVVRHGENGLIVRPGDSEDLAEKLEWVISNRDAVLEAGMNNQQYAFANFESKKSIAEVAEVYQRMVQGDQ